MCGIAGVFAVAGRIPEQDRAGARRAAEAMHHRGPDALREFEQDGAILVHNRLAIIDLTSGDQPMVDPVTGSCVVFNGEIYNYVELRQRLEARGVRFQTSSDTEVLLMGYRVYGDEVLQHLNGMFAFAIHDPGRGALVLGRDRFGEKPVHYFESGGCFYFASELSALRQFPACPTASRDEGVLEYFAFGGVSGPRTILSGVEQLPPGHAMEVNRGGKRSWRYYQRVVPGHATRPCEEAIESALSEAVRIRLRSDVPLAFLLSGGLDSTLITSLARRVRADDLHTFAFGWVGEPSELPFAKEVARELGTIHHEILLEREGFLRDLPVIIRHMDSPQADSAAVVVFGLSRAIGQEGVRVVLSGEGGDELFGGYPWYAGWDGPRARIKRLLRSTSREARNYVEGKLSFPRAGLASAFGDRLVDGLIAERSVDMGESGSDLNGRIALDYARFIPSVLMPKVDRMSMAHSIEVRAPFLDHTLVDQWAALPAREKAVGRRLKVRIRKFGERTGLIPRVVLGRAKMGMNLPLTWWVREHQDLFREALMNGRSTASGLFGQSVVAGWFRALGDQPLGGWSSPAQRIWSAGVFELWQSTLHESSGTAHPRPQGHTRPELTPA